MTDHTPWSPADADVEAAAKALAAFDRTSLSYATLVAECILPCLHARGWRDASEVESVTYLRTRLDTLTAAHDRVIADRDALAARVKVAEADRDRAEAKLMEAAETMDRDGARAARLAAALRALVTDIRCGPAAMAIDDNVMVSAERALAADTAEKEKA